MERSLQRAAVQRAELGKYDKALREYLEKHGLRRDMDVEELHLDNKDLSELRSLDRFRKLNRLWLQANKLKRLPFLYKCDSITELYLSDNLLQTIDHAFRTLVNVNVLFLSGNQLTDLKGVADELSFLKHLKNLNLYDNPISLEPNYRKLIIFTCKSLEVFDRNTITKIEKRKSSHFYDSARLQVEQMNGFMRCIDPREIEFLDRGSRRGGPLAKAKSFSVGRFEPEKSITYYDMLDLDQLDQAKEDRVRNDMRRSVKEFSHFDWTRVKLHENEYLEDQIKNVNIFAKNTSSAAAKKASLPSIESVLKSSNQVASGVQPSSSVPANNLSSLAGPQVITIRLA